jgi:hypothetical protein
LTHAQIAQAFLFTGNVKGSEGKLSIYSYFEVKHHPEYLGQAKKIREKKLRAFRNIIPRLAGGVNQVEGK